MSATISVCHSRTVLIASQIVLASACVDQNYKGVFQEQHSHLIHHGGALDDEPPAHPMQRLQLDLLRRLRRDAPHMRSTSGFGNRVLVIEIVLVGLRWGFTNCAGMMRIS
jgi:hypothetical protein